MIWKTGCVVATVILLTACSGAQPYHYQDNREIPAGPGLFSGADGTFGSARPNSKDAQN